MGGDRAALGATGLAQKEQTSRTHKLRRVGEPEWDLLRNAALLNAPTDIALTFAHYIDVWIRDNKPINETVLKRTLTGMSLAEWYGHLTAAFSWLTIERHDRLRNAGAYAEREHDILTLDTTRLLERHVERVELAHLNTRAVHAGAKYRRGRYLPPIVTHPWASGVGWRRESQWWS
jgi:hypothetical protein